MLVHYTSPISVNKLIPQADVWHVKECKTCMLHMQPYLPLMIAGAIEKCQVEPQVHCPDCNNYSQLSCNACILIRLLHVGMLFVNLISFKNAIVYPVLLCTNFCGEKKWLEPILELIYF